MWISKISKNTGILNTVISDIVDIVVIGTVDIFDIVDIVDIDHTIYWHCCSNMNNLNGFLDQSLVSLSPMWV